MNDNGKTDLIRHMAERLRNHTEPYKEGAWERFAARSAAPSRGRRLWVGWAAAAAVLLVVLSLLLFNKNQPEDYREASRMADNGLPVPDRTSRMQEPQHQLPLTADGTAIRSAKPSVSGVSNSAPHRVLAAVHAEKTAGTVPQKAMAAKQNHAAADTVQETPPLSPEQPAAGLPSFAGTTAHEPAIENTGTSGNPTTPKWDIGLVVSPSLTSEQLNIGGGFAVAYRVSDKFSLTSGISLNGLGVGQQPNDRQSLSRQSLSPNSPVVGLDPANTDKSPYSYREVTSVTSTLLAVDVPLNLRYHVTKSFYTSVGVSFLGVLNERRTNHFVDHINQPTDYSNHLKAVHSAERSVDAPLKGKGYAGFINFAVGHNIPLSPKRAISVEPYFKLPVGRLAHEDMDLTNGGIRIITGF